MLLLSMAMLLLPTVCCAAVGTAGVAGVVVDGLLEPALGVGCEEGVEFPPPPPPQAAKAAVQINASTFFHVVSSFFKLNLEVSVFGNKS